MMSTVTHITGPRVKINGRVIQRCLICGEKLKDSKGLADPDTLVTWESGIFVRTKHGKTRAMSQDIDGPYPKDGCEALVE